MAVFSYQAIDSTARNIAGTVAADSPREAREKLRAQGLLVQTIAADTVQKTGQWTFRHRPKRYASLLATTVRDLSTLLSTGIGLVQALDTLCAQNRGHFQKSLLSLRESVASGSSLSEAMKADPGIYDELTIQMVHVGENAGTLDVVLDRLADFRERYLLFKDRITTALIYPAIIVVLAVCVSIFLMTVVLPMLLENLVAAGKPLPLPTRILKTISDVLVNQGGWILAGLALAVLGVGLFLKTTTGKRAWDRTLFAIPLLGSLAKKQELARTAIIISTLMKNGIVFIDATRIAARATKNVLLRDALEAMRESVESGRDISKALESSPIFPPLVIQIFLIGQQTGELEEMLARLSDSYDRQVTSATARLTAAIEPILIVFLAIVVGFILFATILPIIEAGNVL